jgi:hypothetical protein
MDVIKVNKLEETGEIPITPAVRDRDPVKQGYAFRELRAKEVNGVERSGFSVIKGYNLINVYAGFCVRNQDGSYTLEPGVADLTDLRVRPTEEAAEVGAGLLSTALGEAQSRGFEFARAELASPAVVSMIDGIEDGTAKEVRLFDEPAGDALHTADLLSEGYEVTEQEAQQKLSEAAQTDAMQSAGAVSAIVLL